MDMQVLYTEEPIELIDCDYPGHTSESLDSWDIDDSSFEDTYEKEGYTWYPCGWAVWLKEGEPFCEVDELVQEIASRCINRYDAASEADLELDRLLHIRRENDLRIGEVLNLFKKKKGEDYLGHRSIGTFAVEHLSFSGRLASELMHNSEALSALPLTKKAYLRGELLKSSLRHLSRVLTPENEAEWLSKAQNLSIAALEKAVRQALNEKGSVGMSGEASNSPADSSNDNNCTQCEPAIPSEESDESNKGVMMYFNVSCRLAPVWDFALQHFRDKEHYNGPISGFVEALCANNLASGIDGGEHSNDHGCNHSHDPAHSQGPAESQELPIFYRCHMMPEEMNEGESVDDTGMPAEKHPDIAEEDYKKMPWYIFFPRSFYENPDTVEGLAAKLIELASDRQTLDVAMAKLLWAIRDWSLHRLMDYGHIEEYGKKKCDLPKPLLYRLMRLANGFRRHPLIEKAFEIGILSREQARLILRIVNEKNERMWIDYAAHAPSVTLKEELERCARIIEYDCFASTSYNILPGFRYITDDRFHELPEEMKDIIRTGSWYMRSFHELSWPLENTDEYLSMERDRRLEEPWNYFDDVDDFLAYQAEAADSRNRKNFKCACLAGQGTSDQNSENFKCACLAGQGTLDQNSENFKCACLTDKGTSDLNSEKFKCACLADQGTSGQKSENFKCATAALAGKGTSNQETSCPGSTPHDAGALSKAREICTVPHGADPAETFLMDILSDDSGPIKRTSTVSIKFFLPEELYELWNVTIMIYLQRTRDTSTMNAGGMNLRSIHELPPRNPGLSEAFIAALLQDYLLTERIHHKVAHHYAILKRDRFRCQVPGCNCRRNLHVHHIIRRSNGGSDDPENLIVLCSNYVTSELCDMKEGYLHTPQCVVHYCYHDKKLPTQYDHKAYRARMQEVS